MRWIKYASLWTLGGLLIILLMGCATTPTGVTDVSCTAFQSMTYSSRDTEASIKQVREHNAAWRAICDGD